MNTVEDRITVGALTGSGGSDRLCLWCLCAIPLLAFSIFSWVLSHSGALLLHVVSDRWQNSMCRLRLMSSFQIWWKFPWFFRFSMVSLSLQFVKWLWKKLGALLLFWECINNFRATTFVNFSAAGAGGRAELGWEGPEAHVGDLKHTEQLHLIPQLELPPMINTGAGVVTAGENL